MKPKKAAGADSSFALEQESRRMEERLHMLKKMMSIEKASRESSSAHFWGSSQASHQRHSHSGGTGDREGVKGPLRVKLLSDEAGEKASRSRKCGQCEKPLAKVACVECGEDYCLACFARFHQKGALSRHRVRPIKAKGKVKEVKTTIKLCGTEPAVPTGGESPTERSKRGSGGGENGPRETESSGGGKRAIWEGEYDEKASAQSFQEALAEWRAACAGASQEPTAPQTTQAASCSTQTPASDPEPTSTAPTVGKGVNFGKLHGGVSYFEKMMIRRLQTDPQSLVPSPPRPPTESRATTHETVDLEENESDGDTVHPSQYNLFHSGSKEYGGTCYAHTSLPTPSTTTKITTDAPRPVSSVRIEEVKFEAECCAEGTTQVANSAPQSQGKKKVTSSQKKSSAEPVKKTASQKARKSANRKQQRSSASTTTGQSSSSKDSNPQTFSDTVGRILQPHTRVRSSTGPNTDAELSNFFLCEVEESEVQDKVGRSVHTEEPVEGGCGSSRSLPITASVWLPENSLLHRENEAVDKCPDTLEHSVYCIETDLPPPSSVISSVISHRKRSNHSSMPTAAIPEEQDSETEESEPFQEDSSSGEEDSRDEYGKDSEALEDLAWELQSLTSGRCTRCEGEEGDGGAGGACEGEGDSEGEVGGGWEVSEKDREELEAEMERVKSSFEIYQQQIMQLDSD